MSGAIVLLLQVVAFQATLELMAQQFPGAFAGYQLEVTESHQRQKADTSGTAKAVIGSIAKLGAPISEVKASEGQGAQSCICTRLITVSIPQDGIYSSRACNTWRKLHNFFYRG